MFSNFGTLDNLNLSKRIKSKFSMKGPGKGKTNNPKGKPIGTENRTTKEAKEFLQSILYSEFDNVKASLQRTRADSDAKYLDSLVKLLSFIMPKQVDIKSDGEKLNSSLNITVSSPETKQAIDKLNENN